MNFTSDYRFFNIDNAQKIVEDVSFIFFLFLFLQIHRIGENPEIFEEECKKCENKNVS